MQIERGPFHALEENHLPDGSRFLVDRKSETVYALNAMAGAAWDACSAPTTLQDATKEMQRSFAPDLTEEVVGQAFFELQQRNLVIASANTQARTRREVLSTFGKVALPLVVAMTLTEQRAHAKVARSEIQRTPQANPVRPGRTPHCGIIQKFFGGC